MNRMIHLKYSTLEVFHEPDQYGKFGEVRTTFPDGLFSCGYREINTENITEAESQGYSAPFAVWNSLLDHELLHSIIAQVLFDRPSVVLRTEAGGEFNPSWERYEEEMYAISFQVFLNNTTETVPRPIVSISLDKTREVIRLFTECKENLVQQLERPVNQ